MPDSRIFSKPVVRVCRACYANLENLRQDVSRGVSNGLAVLERPALTELSKLPTAWDTLHAIEEETAEIARLQNGGCTHLN